MIRARRILLTLLAVATAAAAQASGALEDPLPADGAQVPEAVSGIGDPAGPGGSGTGDVASSGVPSVPSLPGDSGKDPDPQPPGEGGFEQGVRDSLGDNVARWGLGAAALGALGLGAFAFVTRYISPKEALKNPQRSMLYGYLRGHPGAHLKQLSDVFHLKTSSILWHMRKLEAAQLVHTDRANGYRVFYPTEGGLEAKQVSRAIAALQNANARAIFQEAAQQPATATDVAQRLGLHGGTVRWHIRKMKDYGILEEAPRGSRLIVVPTQLGRKAAQALAATPAASPSAPPAPGQAAAAAEAAPA